MALYFAWLGFYGLYLIIPAVGFGILFLLQLEGIVINYDGKGIQWYQIMYAIFVVGWSTNYNAAWVHEEKICALAWGTMGFEDSESNRPQFHGDTEETWYLGCFFGHRLVSAKITTVGL